MKKLIEFQNNSLNVRKDDEGKLCLTDLWKLAGSDENKRPVIWQRHETTIAFCRAVCVFLKGDLKSLLKTTKGKGGATWAHEQIALEYAQYLDPNLAIVVNQNFFERIEEEKDPDKIGKRYIKTWEKKGMSPEWIKQRFEGISTRNIFTAKLKAAGVEHEGYRNCTNAIYTPLYGGTSNVVREKKGLDRKDNIRDHLPPVELAAIQLAELMASDSIEKNHLHGNAQCELAATKAGRAVANALLQHKTNK